MEAHEVSGSSEDPEVRRAFSDGILHILRPLSVLEVAGGDSRLRKPGCASPDGSDSTRSALSEPFPDLDESYILLDQRKRKPGKDEGDDMMLLNQFTAEFRQVYDQLITEQKEQEEDILPPEDVAEDRTQTEHVGWRGDATFADSGSFSPQFQSYIDEMLQKCNLNYHLEEKKKRHDQHRRKHRRVRKVKPVDSRDPTEPAERDSLSGVWRMLDAVSEPDGFPITDDQYDLYEDERFEWLLREKVPWQRLEVSKKKCEHWLKMGPTATKGDEKRSRESQRTSGHRRW